MSDLKQTMQRAREFIAANLAECCGSPIAVERGAEEVISAMVARHRELSAILQSQKGGQNDHG